MQPESSGAKWLVDVRFRGATSKTLVLSRLLVIAIVPLTQDSATLVVSGLAAYTTKGCGMKRNSTICAMQSLLVCERTRTHAR